VEFVPSPTFGEGRLCESGPGCVTALLCGRPTLLSRFNPHSYCYCCITRHGVRLRAERQPTTSELMSERHGVAA
jgi:hypothetical protein